MVSIGRNNIQSLSLSNKVVINDEAVSQQLQQENQHFPNRC